MPRRKTHAEFIEQVKGRPFTVLGRYLNNYTKIEFLCCWCGGFWFARPLQILQGNGCPHCVRFNGVVGHYDGWLSVDISTPAHPDAIMFIDSDDWNVLQSRGAGRVCLASNGYPVCNINGILRPVHR